MSPCSRRDAPVLFQCLSILALLVAWCAWRGKCRRAQALGAVGLKRGTGLKTRVGRPTAGSATYWYGSTHDVLAQTDTNHRNSNCTNWNQARSWP